MQVRPQIRTLARALLLVSATTSLLSSPALQAAGLAEAVSNGQREQALALLADGADVHATLGDGGSALLYAAHLGDAELVAALLKAGADPKRGNVFGAVPLSEAAMSGNTEVVRLLLAHGVDPDQANPEGETALMIAARSGNLEMAELLLEHKATVDAREQWGGQTAVMWAAAQQQPEMIALLAKHGADVNAYGFTRYWDRRTLSEPRPKDMNKGGFTPLLYAAREGCTACIAVLVDAGADLNAPDPDRVSPLNMALINIHFDTAAALIEAGANVNQWDLFGRAPLYNALDLHTLPVGGRPDIPSEDAHSGFEIAQMLLDRGADPNMQLKLRPPYRNAIFDRGSDNPLSNGATPLMRAARAADIESVKLLLEYGALVDLPNARGHTPLMVVSGIDWPAEPTRGRYKTEADSIETIRILLAHGADINARTGDPAKRPITELSDTERGAGLQPAIRGVGPIEGQNALHAAAKIGWNQIAQYLIDQGIEQQVADSAGRTPFDYAMGRFPAAFLQAAPEPLLATARLLQDACAQVDGCTVPDPLEPAAAPAP